MGERAAAGPAPARRTAERRSPARHLRIVGRAPATRAQRAHVARRDLRLLWGAAAALTAIGLVMVLSAGSVSATQGYDGNAFWYFQRQVLYAVAGIAAAAVVSRMRPGAWKAISVPLLAVSALGMLIAAHPTSGTAMYGASRWIDLGPLTIQPSEFAKLGLVAFTATVLAARFGHLDEPRQLLLPLGPVVGLVALLGVAQSDLGTTVILVGSVLLLLFIAGVRLRYLAIASAVGAIGAAALIVGEAYRRTRFFDAWLDPWSDPQNGGYQLIQGLIAFGSGGWFGTGLGTSRAKWDFLPNAHSDFIFAVIGEELGLIGALLVVAAFGVFILAGIRIAVHATTTFERLLAAGITCWIGLQAIINLGAVTGLLPITGVPLPLVSFGGTALVVTLVGVGALAGIARAQIRPGTGGRPARASA
ncbi:MAG TPA: putative lipid II flippase FtsW [Actinomycetota bacterium]|nr:putative lipid II flippase FtsW [Actinomycetota bacterium]